LIRSGGCWLILILTFHTVSYPQWRTLVSCKTNLLLTGLPVFAAIEQQENYFLFFLQFFVL